MKKLSFFFLLILIAGCRKTDTVPTDITSGVYVINEGNFGFGNGELSFYDPVSKSVRHNLFKTANGYAPGDVVQSLYVQDSLGFLVVNNSQKIEVVSLPTLRKKITISIPGSSPRYVLPINDSLAYVSELYAKKIWIVNYLDGTLTGQIATNGWTEKMILKDNAVFVQQKKVFTDNNTTNALLKVNTTNHSIQQTLDLGDLDFLSISMDKYDHIWIALDEKVAINTKSSIPCYNLDLVELQSLAFNTYQHHPTQLCAAGESLYFLDGNVYRMGLSDNQLPTSFLINGAGKNLYAMGVSNKSGDIYLSDALDYQQSSRITRYSTSAEEMDSFTAGVISGNFTFYEH